MKIIVASKNPVKIQAVRDGFSEMFPNQQLDVIGTSVSSGVPDQPMSNDETYQGAWNRAMNAHQEFLEADFRVGLEGGVEHSSKGLEAFARAVVHSEDLTGKARTASFFLPPAVTELVLEGMELGEADDIVFKRTNSKQQNGAIGLLTHDRMTRTSYYKDACLLACIPHINHELYLK